MALKNYSTEVPANRSIAEIQQMLQAAGLDGLMFNYEKGTGRIESLIFRIDMDGQPRGFKLPVRWREAKAKLMRDGIRKAGKDDEYCYRVAWRIIRNWLEQQMALLEIEMVDLGEIFLPYTVQRGGKTLYENILENPQILLGEGK